MKINACKSRNNEFIINISYITFLFLRVSFKRPLIFVHDDSYLLYRLFMFLFKLCVCIPGNEMTRVLGKVSRDSLVKR